MSSNRVSSRDVAQIARPLRSRTPFKTNGALWGTDRLKGTGHLPDHLQVTIRVLASEGGLSYVVYSGTTPIAWRTIHGDWHQPNWMYSVTASRHQDVVREALRTIGAFHG